MHGQSVLSHQRKGNAKHQKGKKPIEDKDEKSSIHKEGFRDNINQHIYGRI